MLINNFSPRSVVDVGCGVGAWLSVFIEHGVNDVLGMDGDYISESDLVIPRERFVPWDLEKPLEIDRRFDMALCLEVAEHLEPDRAISLVADLVSIAPVVVFGAAIPGQGGLHHVNEQWQSYWSDLFATHGFVPSDPIRREFWNDNRVYWWHRQNTLIYTVEESSNIAGELVDLVHPCLFSRPRRLTLRQLLSSIPSAAVESIRYRIR
jgi:hypothetical protein